MELIRLYELMYKARAFELALAELWSQGLISGEMHLGTGEEAIAAGVAAHLEQGDAVALDHRGTPILTLLGVDLTSMLKEMLGREDGLCRGRGGHMHLFAPERLAASSGIVGSSAPIAAGFALAAKRLRPGRVGVAFFGDGALNQGMLLEALNLAVAWSLPAIFVCKDNGWAITTRSSSVTGAESSSVRKDLGCRPMRPTDWTRRPSGRRPVARSPKSGGGKAPGSSISPARGSTAISSGIRWSGCRGGRSPKDAQPSGTSRRPFSPGAEGGSGSVPRAWRAS